MTNSIQVALPIRQQDTIAVPASQVGNAIRSTSTKSQDTIVINCNLAEIDAPKAIKLGAEVLSGSGLAKVCLVSPWRPMSASDSTWANPQSLKAALAVGQLSNLGEGNYVRGAQNH